MFLLGNEVVGVGGLSWDVHGRLYQIVNKLRREVMKVFGTMKGDSFLLETNCNIIEKIVMYLWHKHHQPLKEGLATQWT